MGMNRSAERTRRDIVRLCHAGLAPEVLLHEVLRRLQPAVPSDAFLGSTADPATLLFTSAFRHAIPAESMPLFQTNEFLQDDVNKLAMLARGSCPIGTLYAATDGKPLQSPRYRDILAPLGLGDELRAALVAGTACWGFLCLFRERDRAGFTPEEVAFLHSLTSHLGEGMRAALLLGGLRKVAKATSTEPGTESPGLLVLTEARTLAAVTAAARAWLAELGDWAQTGELPDAVLALAARLQAHDRGAAVAADVLPRARVRTRRGQWLVMHAARLDAGDGALGSIAIMLERARPLEVAPLLLSAYTLTARETEVAQLVLRGWSTEAIGDELCISALTVQQHLKAVFDKAGVRSRRELISQVFDQQYGPRIAAGQPLGADGWFA